MLRVLIRGWSLLAIALLLATSSANAVPMIYAFDSGTATLSVTLDDVGQTNVLDPTAQPSVTVNVALDGSQVVYDPIAGPPDGTLLSLMLTAATASLGSLSIDLTMDSAQVDLTSLSIIDAMLNNDSGASAILSGSSFLLDTIMDATVSGVRPDTSTFGPVPSSSLTSQATGSLFVSGSQINIGLFGINLATFAQIVAEGDPPAPDIVVKADFTFVGTLVPEPGTALLLGMGLIGLGCTQRRGQDETSESARVELGLKRF
jgi:hypothetical protein